MERNLHYCIVLSEEQEDFLLARAADIDRMASLHSLMRMAVTKPTSYKMKGFETVLLVGQCAASKVELAQLWKCNRKTVARMLDAMNRLGLVRSDSNNRTSVHTLLCLSGWLINGQMLRNPFYQRPTMPNAADTDSGTQSNDAAKSEQERTMQQGGNGSAENLQSENVVDSKNGKQQHDMPDYQTANEEGTSLPALSKEEEKSYNESLADYYSKCDEATKENRTDEPHSPGKDKQAAPSSSLLSNP